MKLDSGGDVLNSGQWFKMPVQHHVLALHGWHAVLFTPSYPLSQKHESERGDPAGDTALDVHL
jgi:hypothetical protein